MKSCARESEVMAAMQGGLPEELLRHLEGCEVCSEAVTIFRNLSLVANEPFDAPLPSAALIWWKAALSKHRRARQTILWMQRSVYAAAMVLAITLGALQIPAMLLPSRLGMGVGLIGLLVLPFTGALFVWSRVIGRERL